MNERITYDSYNKILNLALEYGYDVDVIEGVLNDTYIIHNVDKELYIKGAKSRRYIILYPQFATEWSNSFHVLLTDSEEKMQEFLNQQEA
jgi:hypothetical protein